MKSKISGHDINDTIQRSYHFHIQKMAGEQYAPLPFFNEYNKDR